MEHRYSRRWVAGIEARVYKRGTLVAQGRILDVSMYGLFLQLEEMELGLHQALEVEVVDKTFAGGPSQRLRTLVARIGDEGVGLEFDEVDDSGRLLLKRLILALREQEQEQEKSQEEVQAAPSKAMPRKKVAG